MCDLSITCKDIFKITFCVYDFILHNLTDYAFNNFQFINPFGIDILLCMCKTLNGCRVKYSSWWYKGDGVETLLARL